MSGLFDEVFKDPDKETVRLAIVAGLAEAKSHIPTVCVDLFKTLEDAILARQHAGLTPSQAVMTLSMLAGCIVGMHAPPDNEAALQFAQNSLTASATMMQAAIKLAIADNRPANRTIQ